jgi:hypothetical protein
MKTDPTAETVFTKPLEGLGADIALLKRICAEHIDVVDSIDQEVKGKHGGDRKSEKIKGVIHSLDTSDQRDRSGQHTDVLDLIDQEVKGKHGGDHGNQHTGGKDNNVILATNPTGNERSYALRRLRKDRPDLHKKVIAFEMSPHARGYYSMIKFRNVPKVTPAR